MIEVQFWKADDPMVGEEERPRRKQWSKNRSGENKANMTSGSPRGRLWTLIPSFIHRISRGPLLGPESHLARC